MMLSCSLRLKLRAIGINFADVATGILYIHVIYKNCNRSVVEPIACHAQAKTFVYMYRDPFVYS